MAGTILTPSAIWKNFSISEKIGAENIGEFSIDGVVFNSLNIEGRSVKDGSVNIYAEFASKSQGSIAPAILLLQDFEDGDRKLAISLVKQGFSVLLVDLAGQCEGKENYTQYPESITYANYQKVKDSLSDVKGDVRETCWFEWCAATRYALKYLKSLPHVTAVGGFGLGKAATVMWHVAGTDDGLDCAVFALNAGWGGYNKIFKFAGVVEPQFSDDMYKFIAGVDAQSYATHVTCPVLMLSATNSDMFDVDRAFDTVSRVNQEIYTAVHYSVGYIDSVNYSAYKNALSFYKKFLLNANAKLPEEIEVKCDVKDSKIVIEVGVDKENLTGVYAYVSEELADPSLRVWQKISEKKRDGDKFVFNYQPLPESEQVIIFAEAEYRGGFTICSNVICKKFKADELSAIYKSNIVYSSRNQDAESVFGPAKDSEENPANVNVFDKGEVRVRKGPMGIEGVTCSGGLLTFKVASRRFKPSDGAMLMLDVYTKESATLTVKLITDYFGNKNEYLARVKVLGGDVWHNVMLECSKFKTEEGLPLKSYEKIQALSIDADSEYLINNALWV